MAFLSFGVALLPLAWPHFPRGAGLLAHGGGLRLSDIQSISSGQSADAVHIVQIKTLLIDKMQAASPV